MSKAFLAKVTMQAAAVAVGNGTPIDVSGLGALVMQAVLTGTGTLTFEATNDGSTWVAVPATNLNTGAAATTATASGLYGIAVAGLLQVRARVSAWTSGTITVFGVAVEAELNSIAQSASTTIAGPLGRRSDATSASVALSTEDAALLAAAATLATQPISAASLPLPSGAATSALQGAGLPAALGSGTTAQSLRVVLPTDQVAIPVNDTIVGGSTLLISGTAVAVNDTPIPSTDVSAYHNIMIQVTGTFVGTVQLQVSLDNTNFVAYALPFTNGSISLVGSALTSANILTGPISTKYARVICTAYTSGTIAVSVFLSVIPAATLGYMVAVVGNVASAAADNSSPVKIGGKYNSTKPTFTNGQRGDAQIEPNGALDVAEYRTTDGGTTFQLRRVANIFKTASATASGSTALWTPTSGKKFRVMAYMIEVTGFAASATPAISIELLDSASSIGIIHSLSVPVASATTGGNLLTTSWIQLDDGILSAAANNVLNISLNAALTAGLVRVLAMGTEE